MKIRYFLIISVFAVLLMSSCANLRGSSDDVDGENVVVIEDSDFQDSNEQDGELTIFDSDFELKREEDNSVESKKREEKAKIAEDDSVIETMFDAAGNKTEVREFGKNSLIKRLVMRTSVGGKTKVFVYAHNGKVKRIPKKSHGMVIAATGNEIAGLAQIYETRQDRDRRREQLAKNRAQDVEAKRRADYENSKPKEVYTDETETVNDSETNYDDTGSGNDDETPTDDEDIDSPGS